MPNRRVREAHLQEIINGVIDVVVHIIIRPAGTIVELVRIIISPARLEVLERHACKSSTAKPPSVTKLVTNRDQFYGRCAPAGDRGRAVRNASAGRLMNSACSAGGCGSSGLSQL